MSLLKKRAPIAAAPAEPTPAKAPPPSLLMPQVRARLSERSEKRVKIAAVEAGISVQDAILVGLSLWLESQGLDRLEEVASMAIAPRNGRPKKK